jgi:integrase
MDYLIPLADTPLTLITTGFMAKLRDKTIVKKKPSFTNHMLAMLSSAFKHGLEYELAEKNPCAGLSEAKADPSRSKPNRPWTIGERQNIMAMAPAQLQLPLALARYLGMRRGDICRIPRTAYRDGFLSWRTSKTGKTMRLPVVGDLKRIVEAAIANSPKGDSTVLCLNTRGKPWTVNGLTVMLVKLFADLETRGMVEPGLTLHGLRHSVATDLRNLGYSDEQIKDYVGHETAQQTAHYSSHADVSGVLIDMANVLQAGPKRERKMSNRDKKGV